MTLYFLQYNNYFNRIVKKEDTLLGYNSYIVGSISTVAFNPNDDINAEQIVNTGTFNSSNFDYMLAVDDLGDINSRWFVIEKERTRSGQYKLTLKRDSIADSLEYIKTAPILVNRGWLNSSDPFIFNDEGIQFNQIKQNQEYLKDRSGCPWIVGYIASNESGGTRYTAEITFPERDSYDFTINGISNWEYYKYCNLNPNAINNVGAVQYDWYTNFKSDQGGFSANCIYTPSSGQYSGGFGSIDHTDYFIATTYRNRNDVLAGFITALSTNYSDIKTLANTFLGTKYNPTDYNILEYYNNKIIFDSSNNKYYKITINTTSYSERLTVSRSNGGALYNEWKSRIQGMPNIISISDNVKLYLQTYGTQKSIVLEQIQGIEPATLTIQSTRYYLDDSPYDMFCIPYSDDLLVKEAGSIKYRANKDIAFQLYTELGKQLVSGATGVLYDIQLLPYCPIQEWIDTDGNINIPASEVSKGVSYLTKSGNTSIYGGLLWCKSSKGNFQINKTINITDYKIESQTDFCRIVSPDFNAMFEFIPAKNYGVSAINIDYQYKPFTPYIHLNPVFSGLYGIHNYDGYNDPMGLICSNNFSLPIINSSWEQYELQNKNYQNIFDRQIQNMDVLHRYDMIEGGISAILGAGGAGLGAGIATNPIIGAIGGLVSLGGGIADQFIKQGRFNENKALTQDLFNYNLGNIKAVPQSLGRITSFNPNNPIFPILEYYSCTEEEKEALRQKITYKSMKVGRVGKIEDYIYETRHYFSGSILRIENGLYDDSHFLSDIYEELEKGIFI